MKLHADNNFVHGTANSSPHCHVRTSGVALDELATARRTYDLLSPHAGLWAVDGIAACTWGPLDLELGRIALALGRHPEAQTHLERARDSAERVGARLFADEAAGLERQCVRAPEPTLWGVPAEAGAVFRRDRQFWTLSFRGRTVRMKDAKGLHDLA